MITINMISMRRWVQIMKFPNSFLDEYSDATKLISHILISRDVQADEISKEMHKLAHKRIYNRLKK